MMKNSISGHNKLNAMIEKKPPKPCERKPKERTTIEIARQNIAAPARSQVGGDLFQPLDPSEHTGKIEEDNISATSLPLVKIEKHTKETSEILKPSRDRVVMFQLPSSLPIKYPNGSAQMEGNPLVGATDGHIGKIRIHKSGKATAQIGQITFNVENGVFPSCSQLLFSQTSTGLEWTSVPGDKILLTLDLASLLESKEEAI